MENYKEKYEQALERCKSEAAIKYCLENLI
jgi:hypothetical protein